MKKILFIILILLLTSGCSHHITSYTKGCGVDISWTPDSFTPSVKAGLIQFLFSMNRENAHIRYTTNAGFGTSDIFGIASLYALITGKEPASSSGAGTVLEIKTGPMSNGYVQKILEIPNLNQNHASIIKSLSNVDNKLSDRQTKITPFKTESNKTPVVVTEKGILGNTKVITPTNEITKDAIKKQVNPTSFMDLIKSVSLYLIIGVIILVIVILIGGLVYFKKIKNVKKEIMDVVEQTKKTTEKLVDKIKG